MTPTHKYYIDLVPTLLPSITCLLGFPSLNASIRPPLFSGDIETTRYEIISPRRTLKKKTQR